MTQETGEMETISQQKQLQGRTKPRRIIQEESDDDDDFEIVLNDESPVQNTKANGKGKVGPGNEKVMKESNVDKATSKGKSTISRGSAGKVTASNTKEKGTKGKGKKPAASGVRTLDGFFGRASASTNSGNGNGGNKANATEKAISTGGVASTLGGMVGADQEDEEGVDMDPMDVDEDHAESDEENKAPSLALTKEKAKSRSSASSAVASPAKKSTGGTPLKVSHPF
jgi:hypothetical protein